MENAESVAQANKTTKTESALPKLWEHQRRAIEIARNKFALFFDPGCGKTRTAIELYKKACVEEGDRRLPALIVAPLTVCHNWLKEIEKYLDDAVTGRKSLVTVIAGQSKAKKLELLGMFKSSMSLKGTGIDSRPIQFLIINQEVWRSEEYRKLLMEMRFKFVVVDESHNFKSHNAQQTKALMGFLNIVGPKYLYLLTGTPAPQGEIDLWSTFAMLGLTKDSFFLWRKKYFDDANEKRRGAFNYWPDYKPSKRAKIEFPKWLEHCSITAKKDLVLDLPPLIRTNLYSEMGPKQAKHYETMEEFLFAVDEDGNELNAANFLSRTLRLQQILAGFMGETPIIDNERISALKEGIKIALDANAQFIIWTIFKSTYAQIGCLLNDLDISFAMLTGEENVNEKNNNIVAFQNGEIKCLIAHPKAGGVGVNLTAASYSIHYTRSFNLVDDLQSEARNYRGGSERHKRITRIDIITPNTLDEDIAEALANKKTIQDVLMGVKQKHGGRKHDGAR